MRPAGFSPEKVELSASRCRIRQASKDDLPQVQRIESIGMSDPWNLGLLADELDHRGSRLLVACDGPPEEPIAYLALRILGKEAEILRLVVEPPYRNRGVAKRLLIAAFEHFAASAVSDCFLEVREDNHPALQLYRQHSFRITHRRPAYYADGATGLVLHTRLGGRRRDESA